MREIYPESYYEEKKEKGRGFCSGVIDLTKEIVSAAVLKEEDYLRSDEALTIYVHNFVSRIEEKGAGSAFLRCVKSMQFRKARNISGGILPLIMILWHSIYQAWI